MFVHLIALTPLASALLWTLALMIEPSRWDAGSVLLIGVGLIISALTSVIGIVLTGGRWARHLGLATLAGCLGLAVARPIDAAWVAAMASSAVGLIGFGLPVSRSMVRRLPSASGPPQRAVLLTLSLTGIPFLLGFSAWSGTSGATIAVGIAAPIVAFWYSRVLPGGLLASRYGWPLLAIGLAPLQPLPAGLASVTTAVVVAVTAHGPSVKVAFYPPRETGTAYPIPPELAPPEILDAASIDDRGKRL